MILEMRGRSALRGTIEVFIAAGWPRLNLGYLQDVV